VPPLYSREDLAGAMLRGADRSGDRCKPIEKQQPAAKLPDAGLSHLHVKMGSRERQAQRRDVQHACDLKRHGNIEA
jgi:hypothetical protein